MTHDGKPRGDQVQDIIGNLREQRHLSAKAMPRTHHLSDMCDGVGCSEERAIQPSTALTDEFWQVIRDVGLANSTLDVAKHPEIGRVGDMKGLKSKILTSLNWLSRPVQSTKYAAKPKSVPSHFSNGRRTSSARSRCQI